MGYSRGFRSSGFEKGMLEMEMERVCGAIYLHMDKPESPHGSFPGRIPDEDVRLVRVSTGIVELYMNRSICI